ncbi:MAG: VWA domain-containing protein [Pseudomonadota bacterium]
MAVASGVTDHRGGGWRRFVSRPGQPSTEYGLVDIGGVHFMRPEGLYGLLAVPVLVWALMRYPVKSGGWRRIISADLQPFVLERSDGRRSRRVGLLLLLSGVLAAATVALAGPSWDFQTQSLRRGGDPLVLALDLSRSMNVADLKPSRLARAKIKLLELLEQRSGRETALVVYSGNAFMVSPLSDDSATIAALVNSLSTDIMPSRGSYPAAAIEKAAELLRQAGHDRGSILLVADGGQSAVAADAAAVAAEEGFTVSVLGVGTPDGGPVPAANGGFETSADGRVAIVGLDERELGRLASAGNGRYARLSVDDGDLATLIAENVGATSAQSTEQSVEIRADGGIWLVLALLPLTALVFRRGWILVLVVVLAPIPTPAAADTLSDWFANAEQRAERALNNGDFERAARLSDDPERRAAALYRSGQFGDSAALLNSAATVRGHYNRGNALARMGDYTAALAAYDAALELEPTHEDALFNREIVAAAMQAENDAGDPGESNDGEGTEDQAGESGDNGDSSDNGESGQSGGASADADNAEQGGQSEASEPGELAGDTQSGDDSEVVEQLREAMQAARDAAATDEGLETVADEQYQLSEAERAEQEALQSEEQWLRRIEDDPGGLLRRKFLQQYRLQGFDQDGRSLWPDNEEEPW